jgi:hypothetical protein
MGSDRRRGSSVSCNSNGQVMRDWVKVAVMFLFTVTVAGISAGEVPAPSLNVHLQQTKESVLLRFRWLPFPGRIDGDPTFNNNDQE